MVYLLGFSCDEKSTEFERQQKLNSDPITTIYYS